MITKSNLSKVSFGKLSINKVKGSYQVKANKYPPFIEELSKTAHNLIPIKIETALLNLIWVKEELSRDGITDLPA